MRMRSLVLAGVLGVVLLVGAAACVGPTSGTGSNSTTVPATTTTPATTSVPAVTTTSSATNAPTLVGFDALGPIAAGQFHVPVATLKLSGPATTDTFVAVTSSLNGCISISGGGVTVAAGAPYATVIGSALNACDSVTLTARLGSISLTTTTKAVPPTAG
jgi:hypothetical protein